MISSEEGILIRDLANAIGKSAEFVHGQYFIWCLVSAIGWVVLGILICFAATRIKFDENHSEIAPWGQFLIRGIIIFIGALFIVGSLPNLLSPSAAAIHQIFHDVRGVSSR